MGGGGAEGHVSRFAMTGTTTRKQTERMPPARESFESLTLLSAHHLLGSLSTSSVFSIAHVSWTPHKGHKSSRTTKGTTDAKRTEETRRPRVPLRGLLTVLRNIGTKTVTVNDVVRRVPIKVYESWQVRTHSV